MSLRQGLSTVGGGLFPSTPCNPVRHLIDGENEDTSQDISWNNFEDVNKFLWIPCKIVFANLKSIFFPINFKITDNSDRISMVCNRGLHVTDRKVITAGIVPKQQRCV